MGKRILLALLTWFAGHGVCWADLSAAGSQNFYQGHEGLEGVVEGNDRFGEALVRGDFNGDGIDDLAVGVPREDAVTFQDAGAVHVIYGLPGSLSTVDNQLWVQGLAGLPGNVEEGDEFGFALAAGDFDGDGFDDLAAGAPGEGLGSIDDVGIVIVMFGGPSGLTERGSQVWSQDTIGILGEAEAGDRFGAALAAGDFDGDGRDDLAIGAPREDIDGFSNAGVFHVLYGTAAGLGTPRNQVWYQGTPDIPGQPEPNDRFGEVLTAGALNGDPFDDLVVGVPAEDVGSAANAGAINIFFGSGAGIDVSDALLVTPSVMAAVEEGDDFGESVAIGSFDGDPLPDIAIGAPRRDLGATVNAGVVFILTGENGFTTGGTILSQNLFGTPDGAEALELFGSALAVADFDADGVDDLAVGVPGEAVGGAAAAGLVHIFYGNRVNLFDLRQAAWTQSSPGVPNSAEAGDLFGSALAAGHFDSNRVADLGVASRGEGIATVEEVGMIHTLYSMLERPAMIFFDGFEE